MHVFTHLKEESVGVTGLGVYPDGMVEHDGHVGRLLDKIDELGIADDGDGWIRLSQDELAMLTATTRATVNRVLRDLENRRFVELARGRSKVTDRAGLARMAA